MTEQVWSNPNIYCIQVGLPQNPLRNLNVYVLSTPERNLIIDTGFCRPECRANLWQGIEELKLDLSRTVLFLTHLHSDHAGLVWDFVSRGIPVYMGRVDLDYYTDSGPIEHWKQMEEIWAREGFPEDQMARQKAENQARLYAPRPGFPAVPVEDGEKIPVGKLSVLALHTPGHTPGHMVLYLPEERLLFSGDHVLFDITPNISVWNQIPNSLRDYLLSLGRIQELPIRAAFSAHRACKGDVYQRIQSLLEHHARRLDEVLGAVKDHPDKTAYELAGNITWSARGLKWGQFSAQQKWFAMGETLAHLYFLVDKGLIYRRTEEKRQVYCLKSGRESGKQ